MKWMFKKVVCIILAILMVFGPFSESLSTIYADNTDSEFAPDGRTWEEAFPNGAFIFRESYQYTKEGDDTVAIAVYRMGGREGTAIANIAITPVAPEGNTANAAGLKDFEIISPEDVSVDLENEYDTVFIDLVFEDGEYEKQIEVRAIDDDISEPEEFFIATIFDAEGAEFIEDANRFTMCIQDNDPYVESHAAFVQKELSFDKSKGSAVLEVERTGGTQYVFSVDYEAVSGTALEGIDFAKTSGTLAFNCGQETAVIEIPLINDNTETESVDKSFQVVLTNPKGGDIVEDEGSAEIFLYNSAAQTETMNVATLVADTKAVDISSKAVISDKALTSNSEKIKVLPKIKESIPLIEIAPKTNGDFSVNAVVDGNLRLSANQGNWKRFTRLIYRDDKSLEGCGLTDAFLNPRGLNVSNLSGGFDELYKEDYDNVNDYETTSSAGKLKIEIINGRRWRICAAGSADPYGFSTTEKIGIPDLYQNYKTIVGSAWLKLSTNGNVAKFALTADDNTLGKGDTDKYTVDYSLAPERTWTLAELKNNDEVYRPFAESLGARLLNNIENYKYDRPILALLDNSSVNNTTFDATLDYLFLERAAVKNMKYEIVCADGDMYLEGNGILGSIKPSISIKDGRGGTDSNGYIFVGSELLFSDNPSAGPFKIKQVELKKYENGNWKMIDYRGNNTIGIFAGRVNNYAERLRTLSSMNSETSSYSIVVTMERQQKIKVDCSPCMLPQKENQTNEDYEKYKEGILNKVISKINSKGAYPNSEMDVPNSCIYVPVKDVKTFDMNLNGDQLYYNGKMYSGAIEVEEADYTKPAIGMIYYDSEALHREQDVKISCIEAIKMYLDENGNGEIDYEDTLLCYIDKDRDVNSIFAPQKGKDGVYKQKLLQYEYVKIPRKIILAPTDDADLKYDIKAAFISTAINKEQLERMTPEMKMLREIDIGDTKVPVHGAAAAKGSITIPLGGDFSPPVFMEGTGGGWSWDPEFRGNLKNDFENPESITEYETVVGNVTIPEEYTNEYLGCFRNTDQIVLQIFNDESNMIDHYNSISTYRDIVLGDFETENTDPKAGEAPASSNTTMNDTPGTSNPTMDLPDINIPAGPFKLVMGDDMVGFELGIPLFGASYSQSGDKPGEAEQSGLLSKNRSKYLTDMKDAMSKDNNDNIFRQLSKAATDSLDEDFGTNLKPDTQKEASFMIGLSAAFMWKYDNVNARWAFDQAKIFVTFSGEVKVTQRIPPVPVVYVYIIFSAEVKLGLNIDIEETTNEGLRKSEVKLSAEIGLEITVEAGAGVGVDLCKFEIFLRVNTGLVVSLSADFQGIKEFSIKAALGLRVVLLFFTFEMEAISCQETFELGRDPEWQFAWAVFGQDMSSNDSKMRISAAAEEGNGSRPPKVKLRMSKRTFDEQIIGSGPKSTIMKSGGGFTLASIPTGFGFELGEYNAGAEANMLAENLKYSSDYSLFEVEGKNYVVYMIDGGANRSDVDSDTLVMSGITDDGLVNPIGDGGEKKYTVVDRVYSSLEEDAKGDSAFHVYVDGTKVKVAWIDNRTVTRNDKSDADEAIKNCAANTQVKYAVFDAVYKAEGFNEATVIGTPDTNYLNFLPKVGTIDGKSVVLSVKSEPFTEKELEDKVDTFKLSLINQINNTTDNKIAAGAEVEAKKKYPYFDFKVGQYKYMNILYGKCSELSFGVETGEGFKITNIAPIDEWTRNGTRVGQVDFYGISENEFYMAYETNYNYLDGLTNMTAKRLYLRKGKINDDGTVELEEPLLLRSLVDSEDNSLDGVYEDASLENKFEDPFFGGLEFLKGKLEPEGDQELILVFNMNNRYYYIDEESLDSLISEDSEGTITPFFDAKTNEGDSKADLSIGTDGDGNISIIYTMPVVFSGNNAIYLSKYDPYTGLWGKGIMLAMRDMNIYESSLDENWTAEETIQAYEESGNSNARLIFQKPKVVVGSSGSLLLIAQTALTELEDAYDPMTGDTVKMPVADEDSVKGFYSMSFPVGTRKISSPSLLFDNYAFVTGSVLRPRISFKNVGDFAIRGSEEHPIAVNLMLGGGDSGDVISLARWDIPNNIPSGEILDTLIDSENSNYGQVGTQIDAEPLPQDLHGKHLYFTVAETEYYSDVFSYSSLDLANEEMLGKSYYSTNQDKAELVLDDVTIKQGGDIVTINGVRYLPLDINAVLKNYGKVTAPNVTLEVKHRETDSDGKDYKPVSNIGSNGVISFGEIGGGDEKQYSTDNSDYEKDSEGKYIFLTDGSIKLNTANDLLVPLSYFDANSKDKSMELRFEAATTSNEYETDNNIAYARLSPLGSIKIQDVIYMAAEELQSFGIEVESTNSTTDIQLMELQSPGKDPILDEMSHESTSKTIGLKADKAGETLLRIADNNTAIYKDVIVKVVADLPGTPIINEVLPRNAEAVIYFDAPATTGGAEIIRYTIECANVNDETDKAVRYVTVPGRYIFEGLTNNKTYKFRIAATNIAGTGPWTEWTAGCTPEDKEYPPLDAAVPHITGQPEDVAATLGDNISVEVTAAAGDGGTLSYQWYKNSTKSSIGSILIEGATDYEYTPDTNIAGKYYYYCIVKNTNNDALDNKTAEVYSSVAEVIVNKGNPAIVINAEGKAVYNETVTLKADVKGLAGTEVTGFVGFHNNDKLLGGNILILEEKAEYMWQFIPTGTQKLKVIYYGDDNYNSVESEVFEYDIAKADQSAITITGIPKTVDRNSGPYILGISGGNGTGEVTYTITGSALKLDGDKVSVSNTGTAVITATKAGDDNYNAISTMTEVAVVRSKSSNGRKAANIISVNDVDWSKNPITIGLSKTNLVSAEVVKRMAELYPDRNLVLTGNGYSITFLAGTIRNIPGQDYYDFGILLDSSSNKAEIIKLLEGDDAVLIYFNHNGKLPGEAEIKINVGDKYAGKTLYYYHYNEATGKLEFMQNTVVDKDGYATVRQSICSDYVFSSKKKGIVQLPIARDWKDTTVPYFVEAGKSTIVGFSAAIGDKVHLYGSEDETYLFKNNAQMFTDISNHWAKPDIDYITARELFRGTGEGKFSPGASMTRGMAVTVLGRLWNINTNSFKGSRFDDVSEDAYYAPYVEWAARNGIVSGIGSNNFAPERAISREEMAVILANFAEFTKLGLDEASKDAGAFADEGQISTWAKSDIIRIKNAGVINGKPGNLFDPKGLCTRAEVSTILRRLILNMVK